MNTSLRLRDRRALLVGLTAIAGLLLAFRGIPAWLRWRSDARATAAEAIAQERRRDAVVTGLARSLDSLEARTERLQQLGPAFVTGTTPAEAASTLAGLVAEMARASLVRLDAIEMKVDSADRRRLPRVKIEAQATADVAGLAALLRRFEQGPTLLAVRRLSVRAPAVDGAANQPETLALRFTVEGLALVR
jgi:type II secretion system (T2SS) protein M